MGVILIVSHCESLKTLELSLHITAHDLIDRCRRGDTISYRLLYDQHVVCLYNTALRITNNKAATADILEQVFTHAFRILHSFRTDELLKDWLKKEVIKKSVAKVQGDKKRWADVDIKHIDGYAFQGEIEEVVPVTDLEVIKNTLSLLPDGYRTVLALYLFEDCSYETISSILGISPDTVSIQYKRAQKKLLHVIHSDSHPIIPDTKIPDELWEGIAENINSIPKLSKLKHRFTLFIQRLNR